MQKNDVFDLDSIVSEQRYVKYGGERYKIVPVSIMKYAEYIKSVEGDTEKSTDSAMLRNKEMIKLFVPDFQIEKVESMTYRQLFALVDFLMKSMTDSEKKTD